MPHLWRHSRQRTSSVVVNDLKQKKYPYFNVINAFPATKLRSRLSSLTFPHHFSCLKKQKWIKQKKRHTHKKTIQKHLGVAGQKSNCFIFNHSDPRVSWACLTTHMSPLKQGFWFGAMCPPNPSSSLKSHWPNACWLWKLWLPRKHLTQLHPGVLCSLRIKAFVYGEITLAQTCAPKPPALRLFS